MRLNGNLVLNAGGLSEIQNAVVERVSQLPSFSAAEKGRFVFLTTEGKIYYNDGVQWSTLATGGNAANLQAEVDQLEASLGNLFTQAGGFDKNGAAFQHEYTGSSLTQLLVQLDQYLATAEAATASEADRATAAEAALSASLAAEVSARQAADSSAGAALAAEASARQAADATLTSDLASEVSRATSAESALTSNLASEVSRAQTAEAALQAAIDTEASVRAAADAAETTSRQAADASNYAALTDQIATETTARLAGDAALNTRADGLQAELDVTQLGAGLNVDGTYTAPANTTYLGDSTSLKTADVALDTAIKAEKDRAVAAEASLASGLANEAQLRADGDANLQSQLTAWVNTQLTSNQAADIAETSARIAADAALQAELDATQASIGLDTNGNIIPVTGTNYLDGIASVFAGAFVLDTQMKINADAIAAETTARQAADAIFQSNLDTERDARIAGDLALQTELNTTQSGAGLETDGTYAAPTGSNYLGSAISLKDADYILDGAIKNNADAISALSASSGAALSAETSARQAADAAQAANLAAETTARQAADAAIAADLAAEVSRAGTAEAAIAADLASEVTRATGAEAAIAADLAGLTTRFETIYFLYDGASATSHSVAHGLNQKYANVTVVDAATDEVIIPQAIVFDGPNVLTVTLNTALAIKVVVMAVGPAAPVAPA